MLAFGALEVDLACLQFPALVDINGLFLLTLEVLSVIKERSEETRAGHAVNV